MSMRRELPTVSSQKGRRICWESSRESALSSSEKNGFGSAGGSGSRGAS